MPENTRLPFTSGRSWIVCSSVRKLINYIIIVFSLELQHVGGRFEY